MHHWLVHVLFGWPYTFPKYLHQPSVKLKVTFVTSLVTRPIWWPLHFSIIGVTILLSSTPYCLITDSLISSTSPISACVRVWQFFHTFAYPNTKAGADATDAKFVLPSLAAMTAAFSKWHQWQQTTPEHFPIESTQGAFFGTLWRQWHQWRQNFMTVLSNPHYTLHILYR